MDKAVTIIRQGWHVAILSIAVLVAHTDLMAQGKHPYPRIATFHFYRGDVPPDWHARMDLVDINKTDPEIPRAIKRINPNTVVFSTSGWTVWNSNNPISDTNISFPSSWFARRSDGSPIEFKGNKILINLSNHCPRVNGKRYNELLPEVLIDRVDLTAFDGIASDWLWRKPHNQTDIDLDNNGRNDYSEHGEDWVIAEWQAGVENLLQILRDLMPANKYILVNSGLFHEYGWQTTNGLILENNRGIYGWNGFERTYFEWSQTSREPRMMIFDVLPSGNDPRIKGESKDHYPHMRFMLTITLLGEGYFSFSDFESRALHHFDKYYDEYDVDLGFARSGPQQLSNGCYVRFFDKGVSITNPSTSTQTVTDGDLRSLSGYNGPYYRFRGGQDPQVNNGGQFSRIELYGSKLSDGLIVGDGIILLTEPKTIVADIIVDNQNAETSPGSKPADLQGTWSETNEVDRPYSMRQANHNGLYGVVYSGPGGGSKAVYTPTIGVAGEYDVYEWHGALEGLAMATNVPVTITINGDVKYADRIDQSRNVGRWNHLGRFDFPAGNRARIEISNDADAAVVADAFKLVHLGSDSNGDGDVAAPSSPKGVRVTVDGQ